MREQRDFSSMPSTLRHLLHRVVPNHFDDPLGLASRLVKTRDPAALFAMFNAGLGVVSAPCDWLLSPLEKTAIRQAPPRQGPLVFVCGGPRTGTTLAAQLLSNHLPVSRFTNFTSLFPRSPILATRFSKRWFRAPKQDQKSFYGRTSRLSGMSDALVLWDRWLGKDRRRPSQSVTPEVAIAMQQFFAAWEAAFKHPLLAKCNNLDAVAHIVAGVLEKSYFVCLTRDPIYMAQSLYYARLMIHGSLEIPYGTATDEAEKNDDPIASICEQVRYHLGQAQKQENRIGADRFLRIAYEDVCRDSAALVRRVGQDFLQLENAELEQLYLPPIPCANRPRLEKSVLDEFQKQLADYSADGSKTHCDSPDRQESQFSS